MMSQVVLKALFWVGPALEDLKAFPVGTRRHVGFALYLAQAGGKHVDAKLSKAFGELVSWKLLRTMTETRIEQSTPSS